MKLPNYRTLSALFALLFGGIALRGQTVDVTITAGTATLAPGQSTTLTVWGQVNPAFEGNSSRIFSWYLDLLTSTADGAIIEVDWSSLTMPESDSPDGSSSTSGTGTTSASDDRNGIYNTFLNPTTTQSAESNPGVGQGIVLFTVEVTAVAPGTRTFTVAPGSGVGGGLSDFLVVRSDSGFYIGGIYDTASLTLTVAGAPDPRDLAFTITVEGDTVTGTFNPQPGYDHVIEYSPDLTDGSWLPLPGFPHNGGSATDDISEVTKRFYRLTYTLQGGS